MENTTFISKDKLLELGFTESKPLGFNTGVFVKKNVKIGRDLLDFVNNEYSLIHQGKCFKVQTIKDLKEKYFDCTGENL